jgi:hypothetical protein
MPSQSSMKAASASSSGAVVVDIPPSDHEEDGSQEDKENSKKDGSQEDKENSDEDGSQEDENSDEDGSQEDENSDEDGSQKGEEATTLMGNVSLLEGKIKAINKDLAILRLTEKKLLAERQTHQDQLDELRSKNSMKILVAKQEERMQAKEEKKALTAKAKAAKKELLRLNLIMPDRTAVCIECMPTDTLTALKKKIHVLKGIKVADQRLMIGDNDITGNTRLQLATLGLSKENNTVRLAPPGGGGAKKDTGTKKNTFKGLRKPGQMLMAAGKFQAIKDAFNPESTLGRELALEADGVKNAAWTIEEKVMTLSEENLAKAYDAWFKGSQARERFSKDLAPIFCENLAIAKDMALELSEGISAVEAAFEFKYLDEFLADHGRCAHDSLYAAMEARTTAINEQKKEEKRKLDTAAEIKRQVEERILNMGGSSDDMRD